MDLQTSFYLGDGNQIPVIGFGTYKFSKTDVSSGIQYAVRIGYRHIDCAHLYGNEVEIGEAINTLIESETIKREEIFITSKPGSELFPVDSAGNALYDYVTIEDTWKVSRNKQTQTKAMEKLVDNGFVKSIGLSNFNKKQIDRILAICRIKPTVLQIESHLDFLNQDLINYAESVGLKVTAYSPLGSPGFARKFENLVSRFIVCEIAKTHNKTPGQVLLRHALQRGLIVIPKSSNFERIKENSLIFDFDLSEEEMRALSESSTNERRVNPIKIRSHSEYPFNDKF